MFKKLTDELPQKGQIVWCLRRWTPRHPGNDGKERTEWLLAVRRTDKPLVTDSDASSNCYWSGAESGTAGTFSDVTVHGWVALKEPELEI